MISVIIPVYNVSFFLGECIESVCNQTFTDLEIILIDDGSTDESGMICDAYAQKDSRIKVIHQENRGLSGARNTGIMQAKGEYLVFIDSDDRVKQEMIQILYEVMQGCAAEIVICSHCTIQENAPKGFLFERRKFDIQDVEILSGRECVKKMYSPETVDMTVAWNKLYKRSMFEKLKYPDKRLHEDEFLTYKIMYPLKKCAYLKVPLYEYRIRKESIMGNKNIFRLKDKVDAFEEKYLFFEEKGDTELYYEALRRYETAIAEIILYLEDIQSEKDAVENFRDKFKEVYKERIADSQMASWHKLKYKIFMKNRMLYRILKNMSGRSKKWN